MPNHQMTKRKTRGANPLSLVKISYPVISLEHNILAPISFHSPSWRLNSRSCPSATPFSIFLPSLAPVLACTSYYSSRSISTDQCQNSIPELSISATGTESPVAELAMSLSHGHYKEDSKHPEKASYQEGEISAPYSSPPSDCNSIPLKYFFSAALTTIMAMLAVAALVWRFYTPPPLVL